jgi:hypothetical protein
MVSLMYDTWGGQRPIVGSQVSSRNFFATFNLTQGNPINPTHLGTTKNAKQLPNNRYYSEFLFN